MQPTSYQGSNALSKSALSRFYNGTSDSEEQPLAYVSHFAIGNVTDNELTNQGNEVYIVPRLTDAPLKVLTELLEQDIEEPQDADYVEAALKSRVYQSYTRPVLISTLRKEIENSYKMFKRHKDGLCIIATQEDYKKGMDSAHALKNGLYTGGYFKENDNILNFYQVEVYGDMTVMCPIRNIPVKLSLKGLIDVLRINIEEKVARVIDIKTTSKPVIRFQNSIRDYRYDIQVMLYTLLMEKAIDGSGSIVIRHNGQILDDFDLSGYTMLNPIFLVASSKNENEIALPFELNDNSKNIALNGGTRLGNIVVTQNSRKVGIPKIPGLQHYLESYVAQSYLGDYSLPIEFLIPLKDKKPIELDAWNY